MAEARSGFKNILGKYSVDDQGVMRSVGVLVHNTRETKSGDRYSFSQDSQNENIQFFLVANGQAYNKNLHDLQHPKGSFKFVVNLGENNERLAKITDDASTIDLIYQVDGTSIKVEGNIYHTADSALNIDNKPHSISGVLNDNEDTLRISFEDFPNLGDRDFNDVIFDVNISYGDSISSLNDISPTGGEVDISDKDLYDDSDDIFDTHLINSNNDITFPRNESTAETTSEEVANILIQLNRLLEEPSLLDNDIADYIVKTTTDNTIKHEQKVVSVENNEIDLNTDFDPVLNQHIDYI